MFKNMKLSTKLIGGFGFILLLLLGVTGLYHYAVSTSSGEFSHLLDTEVAIANHAADVEVLMLQCRRAEKDFLLRLDTKYLGKLEEAEVQLKKEVESIVSLAKASGDDQTATKASEIMGFADAYVNDFKTLVNAWELKGLDHKSGLQGQFRSVAHRMMDTTKKHAVEDLSIAMLTIRRYEKDFQRTGSDKYKDKLSNAINTYQQLLEESHCNEVTKTAQEKGLSEYVDAFNKYLSAGESQELKDQYYDLMRAAAHNIEVPLKGIYVPDVKALVLDIRKNEKDYLLRADEKYIKGTHQSVENLMNAFETAGVLPEHVEAMRLLTSDYKKAFDALVEENVVIASATATMREAVHQIEPLVEEVHITAMESAGERSEATISHAKSLALTAVSIAISAVVVGVGLAVIITRSITRPFSRIFAGLKTFSNAELDKLGNNFREIIESLSSGGSQVSAASQSLAEGATEQAAGMEETSSSLEEMSSMTRQNADNAQQANMLASEARTSADNGTEAMSRMSDAINDIQKSSDETAKIIKVIDEIAFQTNLLALNAAVEAARAGEAGKGFAVVAEEVRNLAMRSAEAAKNTSGMIEESVKNSRNGVEISYEVSKVLSEIVSSIQKTSDLVGEISAASSEQAQGIDQISTAMSQMDKVTQQNAANAEESASASEMVMGVVDNLVKIVEGQSRASSHTQRWSAGNEVNAGDKAFHQIAEGQSSMSSVVAEVKTATADDDFSDFNE